MVTETREVQVRRLDEIITESGTTPKIPSKR